MEMSTEKFKKLWTERKEVLANVLKNAKEAKKNHLEGIELRKKLDAIDALIDAEVAKEEK